MAPCVNGHKVRRIFVMAITNAPMVADNQCKWRITSSKGLFHDGRENSQDIEDSTCFHKGGIDNLCFHDKHAVDLSSQFQNQNRYSPRHVTKTTKISAFHKIKTFRLTHLKWRQCLGPSITPVHHDDNMAVARAWYLAPAVMVKQNAKLNCDGRKRLIFHHNESTCLEKARGLRFTRVTCILGNLCCSTVSTTDRWA
jgi:hypothetical protein